MGWNGNFRMKDARMEWKTIFHTNSILDFVQCIYKKKYIYGCRVMIKNIVTEEFNFNIYAYYLATNCGTFVVYIAQAACVLHHSAVNTVHCNLQH